MRPALQALYEVCELLRRSEQSWIDEIENGPEIAKPVLDGRAGKRKLRLRLQLLGDPRLLGVRILDGLRFVEHNQAPGGFRNPWNTQQRAVAGNHQIHILQTLGREGLEIGGRQRRRMGDERIQTRRKAFQLRRPVGEKRSGRNQKTWLPLVAILVSQHQQQREYLNGLAQSHIVGEAGPETELGEQIKPAHAHLLIGTQRAVQSRAGIDASQSLRTAQVPSASPRATDRRPPCPSPLALAAESSSACTSAPAIMRSASRRLRPLSAAARSTSPKCSIIRLSRSRSTSTQRPRTSASPSDLANNSRISAAVKRFAVERDFHAEIEQRILAQSRRRLAADLSRYLRARRSVGLPGRWHSDHYARTLQLRDISQKLHGLGRRPPQGVEDLARIDHGLQPRAAFRRSLHGEKQRQQAILVGRARIFAESLPQRKMLRLGVRRQSSGIGREKSKWGCIVLAVLGEVEVHAADKIPRRVAALQELLYAALRFG